MTLQSSGVISFTDIKAEFGKSDVTAISLEDYYNIATGLPTSTSSPISLNNFYGKKFIVYETITSSRGWTPKVNLARFIHIWVIGAGGSGGHGWAFSNVGIFNNTDGVGGGAGGGAGGVSYSLIAASAAGSSTVTVGVGGAGRRRTSEGASSGSNGTASRFVGSGLNMTGNGGQGGGADTATSGRNDETSAAGGPGGSATGGNQLNRIGGRGGNMAVSGDGVRRSGAGGGAPEFMSGHNGDGFSTVASGISTISAGRQASDYGTFPAILNTYITGRDQTAILNSTRTTFNASNGSITATTGSPIYGAGSGGCGDLDNTGSGQGGDGVVYIIYEV